MSEVYNRMFKSKSPLMQSKVEVDPWVAFKAGYTDKKELRGEIREFYKDSLTNTIKYVPKDDGENLVTTNINPKDLGENQKIDE